MSPLRWLSGHAYGNPALPTRVTLLAWFAAWYLVGLWVGAPW